MPNATIQKILKPTKYRAVDTSTSLQKVSQNLFTNGDFTAWSGDDDPTGWTVVSESGSDPMVTEVSGKARLYHSSPGDIRIQQSVLTIGKRYYYSVEITASVTGSLRLETGIGTTIDIFSTVGVHTGYFTAVHADLRIRRHSSASGTDITIDNAEVYEVESFGNNNHGQIYSGRALEFDGVTDYLNINDSNPSDHLFGSYLKTFACWINFKDVASEQIIAGGWLSDASISIESGKIGAASTVSDDNDIMIDTAVIANTWYRLVVVSNVDVTDTDAIDAAYADSFSNFSIYLNGIKQTLEAGNSYRGNNKMLLGVRHLSTFELYFDGIMSDVQGWDSAWTQSDVTFDYLNPESLALNNGGTSLTESNLKIWYPMQDGHRGQQSYVLDGANTGLGDELVVNGDMELDANWSDDNAEAGEQTHSSAQTHSGNYSRYINADVVDEGTISDGFSTTTGVTYKVNFWVYAVSGTTITLYVREGDGGGHNISNEEIAVTAGQWVEVTRYFTEADGGPDCKTRFLSKNSLEFYIDDVSVKPVNDKHHATSVFYGKEQISAAGDRTFTGGNNWVDDATTANQWVEDSGTYNESASSGATEGTALTAYDGTTVTFTDNYLNLIATSDGSDIRKASLDGAHWEDDGGDGPAMVTGRTYRLSYAIEISAHTSGTFSIGFGDTDVDTDADKQYTGTTQYEGSDAPIADYFDFVYAGTTTHAKLFLQASTSSAFTVFLDNFSLKEVGTATGWTDADQQLDIPQTALQSYNQLAWFDGVGDYVEIADQTKYSFGNSTADEPFTISAWIYMNTGAAVAGFPILSKWDGANTREWVFETYTNGKLRLILWDEDTNGYQGWTYDTALTSKEGEWLHVVATYGGDESDADADITLYINGENVNSDSVTTSSGSYTAMEQLGSTLRIGNSEYDERFANGCITEVSIWDTDLSQADVNELYNDGKVLDALTHSQENNIVGYWRNNGLASWQDLENPTVTTFNGTPSSLTETLLLPAGVDASRDTQGFLMNRQKDTNSLNLPFVATSAEGNYASVPGFNFHATTTSISFWIKTPNYSTDNTILDKYATSGNLRALRLYLYSDNELMLQLSSDGINYESQITTDLGLANDTWYHIAITYSSGTWLVYKNASAVSLDAAAFSAQTAIKQNTLELKIGNGVVSTKDPWDGQIDDLCIYNDVLLSDEVKRNYNAGKRSHRND